MERRSIEPPLEDYALVRLAKLVKLTRAAQIALFEGKRTQTHYDYLRGLEVRVDAALVWVFGRKREDLIPFAKQVLEMRHLQIDFVQGSRLNTGLCMRIERAIDRAIEEILNESRSKDNQLSLFDTPAIVVGLYSREGS